MKTAILAGGKGIRFGEATRSMPKPMIEIGNKPILWHILKHYDSYGFRDFVIALGHKQEEIKRYFATDVPLGPNLKIYSPEAEAESPYSSMADWRIELIDTGFETQTGGRLKRLQPFLGNTTFMLTWGDGISDVDLHELLAFHREHGKLATVTAVRPPSPFGCLKIEGNAVVEFEEKPEQSEHWINGAFFVLEPEVFDLIEGDDTSWEHGPMRQLAAEEQLMAYCHRSFWRCMDTPKDREQLQELWNNGTAPWTRRWKSPATDSPAQVAVHGSSRSVPGRVLVTGHAGYIGTLLTPMLQEAGWEVVGLDSYWFEGCDFTPVAEPLETYRLDVRDVDVDMLRGFDAIIHLAALSNDPLGDLHPGATFEINHLATVDLARKAKTAGVTRFLHSSTCSIYGVAGEEWVDENSEFHPLTPYGVAKQRAERDLRLLADDAFSPTYLRNGTAFGISPKLRGDLVVNNLVGHAVTTGKVLLKSTGMSWRPLVHVGDIAHAFVACLQTPREQIHNRAFNVGCSKENYLVRDIALTIEQIVPNCKVEFAPGASPDKRSYRVNCDLIRREVPAFQPRWNLESGIRELYEAYRQVDLQQSDLEGTRFLRVKRMRELINEGRLNEQLRATTVDGSLRAAG